MPHAEVPFVDPRVEHVAVSKLRMMTATDLKRARTIVIRENERPIAVVLNSEQYLWMQEKLKGIRKKETMQEGRSASLGKSEGAMGERPHSRKPARHKRHFGRSDELNES